MSLPDEAESLIPHRPPFLFVDRVIRRTPGVAAETTKAVSHGEGWVTGHFPGNPVFPGVLILEAMAQCAGIALERSAAVGVAFLAGVHEARFLRPVLPGDLLTIHAKIVEQVGPLVQAEAIASVGDTAVARAKLQLYLMAEGGR